MGNRKWKYPHIKNIARKHFYKLPCWIHRVSYLYPDGTYSHEIKPCVWNKGEKNEYKSYPVCTLQLVCPYVGNYGHNPDGSKRYGALGRCSQECLDPQIRQAIEAFVTLHPHIM